jgi:hypothetical protein
MSRFTISLAVLFSASLAGGHSHAQTMYKCKGPDGSQIFSHQPCPDDAEHLNAGTATATQAFRRTEALAAIGQRKNECLRHATAIAYNQAELLIRQHNDRIDYIEGRIQSGNAGTDREPAMREEIADLRQAIVNEREQADAEFANERQRCEETEKRESAALSGVG